MSFPVLTICRHDGDDMGRCGVGLGSVSLHFAKRTHIILKIILTTLYGNIRAEAVKKPLIFI